MRANFTPMDTRTGKPVKVLPLASAVIDSNDGYRYVVTVEETCFIWVGVFVRDQKQELVQEFTFETSAEAMARFAEVCEEIREGE